MFKLHDAGRIFWCPYGLLSNKSKYFLNFITSDRLYKIMGCRKIYPTQLMSKSICFQNIFNTTLCSRKHTFSRISRDNYRAQDTVKLTLSMYTTEICMLLFLVPEGSSIEQDVGPT